MCALSDDIMDIRAVTYIECTTYSQLGNKPVNKLLQWPIRNAFKKEYAKLYKIWIVSTLLC